MPECDTGPLNKKNIENVFYFKEKPYLCKPKQAITQKLLEKGKMRSYQKNIFK